MIVTISLLAIIVIMVIFIIYRYYLSQAKGRVRDLEIEIEFIQKTITNLDYELERSQLNSSCLREERKSLKAEIECLKTHNHSNLIEKLKEVRSKGVMINDVVYVVSNNKIITGTISKITSNGKFIYYELTSNGIKIPSDYNVVYKSKEELLESLNQNK